MKHTVLAICLCVLSISFSNGQYWNTTPYIRADGVMEVGRYFDFHESSSDNNDFSVRLYSYNNVLKTTSSLSINGLNIDNSDLTYLQNSRSLFIGWNRSSGGGETDFITNRGGGLQGDLNLGI